MANTKRDIGAEILDGIREIKAGKTGRITTLPAVADIRERVGLSQSEFADLLCVSVRTVQEWEQGRKAPSGPARMLLLVADQNPQALLAVASA
jgi:putative transcriptional regulator